jgi:hypothetical protein
VRNVANPESPYNLPDDTRRFHCVGICGQILVSGIVVMGHSLWRYPRFVEHRDRPNKGDFIDNWMSLIARLTGSVLQARAATRIISGGSSAVVATRNLMTFPDIRSA